MQEKPLVSIIIPNYNGEKFLEECLNSVLNQTYSHWEALVVDDGSQDNSPQIIRKFAEKDKRFLPVFLKENQGVAYARNAAMKKARGKYIAFIDADDVWLEEKLSLQISFMEENKLDLCYSSYFSIDENGKILNFFKAPEKVSYEDFLRTSSIGNLTGVFNAERLGKIYVKPYPIRVDYMLWIEILKRSVQAVGIEKPLALYRISPSSISKNKLKAAKWQFKVYREFLGFSLPKTLYYMLFYTYYGVRKYFRIRQSNPEEIRRLLGHYNLKLPANYHV